jgi:hypothetical protein
VADCAVPVQSQIEEGWSLVETDQFFGFTQNIFEILQVDFPGREIIGSKSAIAWLLFDAGQLLTRDSTPTGAVARFQSAGDLDDIRR